MLNIKKILVPTDFSENASRAYSYAQQIASRYDATVDFIHVIPTLQYFSDSMQQLGMPLDMEKDIYPHAKEQASGKINERMENYLLPENKGRGIVQINTKPSKAITNHAEEEGYDLIVMAAKGGHESDLLRGSITEKIIRYSKTPVLTTQQNTSDQIKNVLVPTDGSQASLKALTMAISIALNHDASITLFHVLELHGSLTENVVKNVHKSKRENIRDVIYDALDKFAANTDGKLKLNRGKNFESQLVVTEEDSTATINLTTVIQKSVSAHHGITEYANDHADLTVLATHGRSGLAHLFLGSTTEKVVQHSACPILTIKPDFVEAT